MGGYGAIAIDPALFDPVVFVTIFTTMPGLMLVAVSIVEPKVAVPLTTHVPIVTPLTEIMKLSTLPVPGAATIAQ